MSVTFASRNADDQAPHLNVTNANVRIVLSLIGRPGADQNYGTIGTPDIPAIARRLLLAKNKPESLNQFIQPTVEDGNFIDIGVDRERIERYVTTLLAVCQYATKHQAEIYWS